MIAARFRSRFDKALWENDTAGRSRGSRGRVVVLRVLRTLAVLVRDATQGQLTLRAMGLVYTTLLTLVPLLALSFSVLKAFGVHNQIEPLLHKLLAPLGESSSGELTGRLIEFVGNMNVGVLGSLGLALLLYTSVSLIHKIEESLNFVWHVAQARRLGERFSRYLSLLLVGPILVFSMVGLSASVMSTDIVDRVLQFRPFGFLYLALSRLLPYLLVTGAFTFAYSFIPNTRVRFSAALLGGAAAGLAWQSTGAFFAAFVATSGNYTAIYSGFAALILFLIWLYLSWLILLIGGSIAFYYEHPEYLQVQGGEPRLANRDREYLALAILSFVADGFLAGRAAPDAESLAKALATPAPLVQAMLETLVRGKLLAQTKGERPGYLPARDPVRITLQEILGIVRSEVEAGASIPLQYVENVNEIVRRVDASIDAAVAGLTLKDLVNIKGDSAKGLL